MKKAFLIGIVAIIILVLIGGYFLLSQKTIQENQGNDGALSSKTSSKDVSALVLELSNIPEGYKIMSKGPRVKSDVTDQAINLGWKEGYQISFAKGDGTISDTTTISQVVSKYPIENISLVLETKEEGYTEETLPNPDIGDVSVASKITDDSFGIGFYKIEFVKKDVYVALDTRGDYELLKGLAKKVAEKI